MLIPFVGRCSSGPKHGAAYAKRSTQFADHVTGGVAIRLELFLECVLLGYIETEARPKRMSFVDRHEGKIGDSFSRRRPLQPARTRPQGGHPRQEGGEGTTQETHAAGTPAVNRCRPGARTRPGSSDDGQFELRSLQPRASPVRIATAVVANCALRRVRIERTRCAGISTSPRLNKAADLSMALSFRRTTVGRQPCDLHVPRWCTCVDYTAAPKLRARRALPPAPAGSIFL